jgi:ElaB/YqjD/DUF883 family membrane-anchored ribosome-binding protein
MSKDSISSLSEAIAKLEAVSQEKSQQLKEHFSKDYEEIKSALENLRPHLDEIKSKVEKETLEAKNKIENQVKENPWKTIGIVGLIAFIIGLLLGRKK